MPLTHPFPLLMMAELSMLEREKSHEKSRVAVDVNELEQVSCILECNGTCEFEMVLEIVCKNGNQHCTSWISVIIGVNLWKNKT